MPLLRIINITIILSHSRCSFLVALIYIYIDLIFTSKTHHLFCSQKSNIYDPYYLFVIHLSDVHGKVTNVNLVEYHLLTR